MVEAKEKICFVISPIGKEKSETRERANNAFEGIIVPAIKPLHYKPLRADQMKSPGRITDQVLENITEAPMVIADLTDFNANVFYELSLRHVSEKPIVHIIHEDQIDKIPFDVQAIRIVPYSLIGAKMMHSQEQVRDYVEEAQKAQVTKTLMLDNVRTMGLLRTPAGPDHLKHLQGTILLGNWIRYNVIDDFLDNILYTNDPAKNISELDFRINRILAKSQEEGFTVKAKTLAAFPEGEMRKKVDETFKAAGSIIPPLLDAVKKSEVDAITRGLEHWRANNHEYVVLATMRTLDLIREDQPI